MEKLPVEKLPVGRLQVEKLQVKKPQWKNFMNETDITELMRLTFMLIFRLSGPLLAVAPVVGLVVAMLQAVTQINEATLVFIPKLLGVGAVLLLLGVSMFTSLADFTHFLIDRMVAAGT